MGRSYFFWGDVYKQHIQIGVTKKLYVGWEGWGWGMSKGLIEDSFFSGTFEKVISIFASRKLIQTIPCWTYELAM
jgi:hypothetical protein